MEKVSGAMGTGKAVNAGSRAVIFTHWGQNEEPRGADCRSSLPKLCLRKSKRKASSRKIYSASPINTKMLLITLHFASTLPRMMKAARKY